MIKAVVFDMDGVLIDAKDWHYEALNRALALVGMEISRVDHLTSFDGLPTRRKLEILGMTHGLPRGLHKFINELKQRYTMEIIATNCRPMFAHEYALAELKRAGYVIGVASNSIRASVATMMAMSQLDCYLDVMLSSEDVERPKPDPDIYIKAMAQLNVAPQETLVVEDNDHGIKAARASGAHVMIVQDVSDVTLPAIVREITKAERTAA